MTVKLYRLEGERLVAELDKLAALRITVFRDWPYLYDGDLNYERDYLRVYTEHDSSVVMAAFDGDTMVGAATGASMLDHADDFADAFDVPPVPFKDMFYCAESVLLPAYRGHGLGHAFFDAREAHARTLGAQYSAFCSVLRADDHPLRPSDPRDLGPFWRKRGYEAIAGAVAEFSWKDVDQPAETLKKLQFWGRRL